MCTTKKILIVEDEEKIRNVLSMYFKKEGFAVFETGNGIEALSLAIEEKPDVVLLDNMLPGITGIDLCQKLKSTDDTKNIFVIMLSADPRLPEKTDRYTTGPDWFEKKPFIPKQLLHSVKHLVEYSPIPASVET